MKIVVNFCRIFVGVLFIFSGLIKLNDPLGFSFKLDEYFSAAVLGLEFLQPYALVLSVILVISEVILGIMLLLGFQRKFTVWSLLIMIIFFTFLTFYSAYFNKVTDCGCFGDAIPLVPWESFIKDVVLLVMILILFFNTKLIQPVFQKSAKFIILISMILCFGLAYYVLMHLPILDFRAYKIGTNIEKASKPDPDRPAVYGYDWYYTIEGKQEIVTTEGLPPDGYPKYDSVKTKLIDEGYVPPIHDFTMERDGEDFTPEMLLEDKLAMIVLYNLSKSESDGLDKLNTFITRAQNSGYRVIALSASLQSEAEQLMEAHEFNVDFYITDETALKTVVRSNPGIILVEKGVITAKSHWNDFEEVSF